MAYRVPGNALGARRPGFRGQGGVDYEPQQSLVLLMVWSIRRKANAHARLRYFRSADAAVALLLLLLLPLL